MQIRGRKEEREGANEREEGRNEAVGVYCLFREPTYYTFTKIVSEKSHRSIISVAADEGAHTSSF